MVRTVPDLCKRRRLPSPIFCSPAAPAAGRTSVTFCCFFLLLLLSLRRAEGPSHSQPPVPSVEVFAIVFYETAGSVSPLKLTTPHLSQAAKMQHMIFIINTTEGSDAMPTAPDPSDKNTLLFHALLLCSIYLLTEVLLRMQKDVWTVSWLQLHVLVNDYVKKTYCAWKTN